MHPQHLQGGWGLLWQQRVRACIEGASNSDVMMGVLQAWASRDKGTRQERDSAP